VSTINVNDIDLFYEESGEGYPLVLISGLGGGCATWQTVRNVLSRHYRVIVFDNRGAGRSSTPERTYSITQMADDLLELLKYLNIDKAHVLGGSMGGFIAQEFALMYPAMINKLVLCCTMDKFSRRNKVLFECMYDSWKDGLSIDIWFKELYCWVFSPTFFKNEQAVEFAVQFAVEYPYKQTLIGFKGQLEACIEFNSAKRLKNIYHETLVLAGEDDILITPRESKILTDNIPNSKMAIVTDAGHNLYIEKREEFLKKIIEFLQ
jgi:3-oxoadipate enol-lactonase